MHPKAAGPLLPTAALLAVTAVWGSTFFLIGDLVQEVPPLDFLGIRFVIAAVLIGIVRFRHLRVAPRALWGRGFALGAVYAGAQILQTTGLKTTPASVSGFITGMYVVLTPILLAVFFREQVRARLWIGVLLATIGLGFLSLQVTGRSFGISAGEALTFLGAAGYAAHIILLGRWASPDNAITLGSIQIIAVGIICGLGSVPGGVKVPASAGGWVSILYMAIVAGVGAMLLQTWAQARIRPTAAAVIMTTEPVFAAAFAVLFGGEQPTARLFFGGALILGAMLLVETGPGADKPDLNEQAVTTEPSRP